MVTPASPGYRLNDPLLLRSPLPQRDLDELNAALLLGAGDVA